MGLTTAYFVSNKNLEAFLNAIVTAQAPEKFTASFLEKLGFTSSNDRLFVGVLKGLGFLDDNGVPNDRYYRYLDQTQSGAVLAGAIREAYGDLFSINRNAQEMTSEEVKNKLRTLTQGRKSDKVISLMASTFRALCERADWNTPTEANALSVQSPTPVLIPPVDAKPIVEQARSLHTGQAALHYNIQIHLPESRDPAVFDAIFRALKEHIL